MKPTQQSNDRRRHLRTASHTTAVVVHEHRVRRYVVRNLSQSGALLTGGELLPIDVEVHVILQVAGQAPIRVKARVVHTVDTLDGSQGSGITFLPETPLCAEHIEAALAAELERRTWRIAPEAGAPGPRNEGAGPS